MIIKRQWKITKYKRYKGNITKRYNGIFLFGFIPIWISVEITES